MDESALQGHGMGKGARRIEPREGGIVVWMEQLWYELNEEKAWTDKNNK
jgi:hypothetical protein